MLYFGFLTAFLLISAILGTNGTPGFRAKKLQAMERLPRTKIIYLEPDVRSVITHPKGGKIIWQADGRKTVIQPDGTSIILKPNGRSLEIFDRDPYPSTPPYSGQSYPRFLKKLAKPNPEEDEVKHHGPFRKQHAEQQIAESYPGENPESDDEVPTKVHPLNEKRHFRKNPRLDEEQLADMYPTAHGPYFRQNLEPNAELLEKVLLSEGPYFRRNKMLTDAKHAGIYHRVAKSSNFGQLDKRADTDPGTHEQQREHNRKDSGLYGSKSAYIIPSIEPNLSRDLDNIGETERDFINTEKYGKAEKKIAPLVEQLSESNREDIEKQIESDFKTFGKQGKDKKNIVLYPEQHSKKNLGDIIQPPYSKNSFKLSNNRANPSAERRFMKKLQYNEHTVPDIKMSKKYSNDQPKIEFESPIEQNSNRLEKELRQWSKPHNNNAVSYTEPYSNENVEDIEQQGESDFRISKKNNDPIRFIPSAENPSNSFQEELVQQPDQDFKNLRSHSNNHENFVQSKEKYSKQLGKQSEQNFKNTKFNGHNVHILPLLKQQDNSREYFVPFEKRYNYPYRKNLRQHSAQDKIYFTKRDSNPHFVPFAGNYRNQFARELAQQYFKGYAGQGMDQDFFLPSDEDFYPFTIYHKPYSHQGFKVPAIHTNEQAAQIAKATKQFSNSFQQFRKQPQDLKDNAKHIHDVTHIETTADKYFQKELEQHSKRAFLEAEKHSNDLLSLAEKYPNITQEHAQQPQQDFETRPDIISGAFVKQREPGRIGSGLYRSKSVYIVPSAEQNSNRDLDSIEEQAEQEFLITRKHGTDEKKIVPSVEELSKTNMKDIEKQTESDIKIFEEQGNGQKNIILYPEQDYNRNKEDIGQHKGLYFKNSLKLSKNQASPSAEQQSMRKLQHVEHPVPINKIPRTYGNDRKMLVQFAEKNSNTLQELRQQSKPHINNVALSYGNNQVYTKPSAKQQSKEIVKDIEQQEEPDLRNSERYKDPKHLIPSEEIRSNSFPKVQHPEKDLRKNTGSDGNNQAKFVLPKGQYSKPFGQHSEPNFKNSKFYGDNEHILPPIIKVKQYSKQQDNDQIPFVPLAKYDYPFSTNFWQYPVQDRFYFTKQDKNRIHFVPLAGHYRNQFATELAEQYFKDHESEGKDQENFLPSVEQYSNPFTIYHEPYSHEAFKVPAVHINDQPYDQTAQIAKPTEQYSNSFQEFGKKPQLDVKDNAKHIHGLKHIETTADKYFQKELERNSKRVFVEAEKNKGDLLSAGEQYPNITQEDAQQPQQDFQTHKDFDKKHNDHENVLPILKDLFPSTHLNNLEGHGFRNFKKYDENEESIKNTVMPSFDMYPGPSPNILLKMANKPKQGDFIAPDIAF